MKTVLTLILLASPGAAPDLRVHRDVAYTDSVDRQRTLDVYAPADGQDQPILIWVHGGGWRQGDKSNVQRKPRRSWITGTSSSPSRRVAESGVLTPRW